MIQIRQKKWEIFLFVSISAQFDFEFFNSKFEIEHIKVINWDDAVQK